MSRKSISKSKREIVTWFNCEKCGIYTTSKTHTDEECLTENYGFKQYPHYIHKNVLYLQSLSVGIVDDLSLSTKNLENLIFVNETALRIAECKIGDNVLIKTIVHNLDNDDQTSVNFVRIVWPLPETTSNVVVISKEGMQTVNFIFCTNLKILWWFFSSSQ